MTEAREVGKRQGKEDRRNAKGRNGEEREKQGPAKGLGKKALAHRLTGQREPCPQMVPTKGLGKKALANRLTGQREPCPQMVLSVPVWQCWALSGLSVWLESAPPTSTRCFLPLCHWATTWDLEGGSCGKKKGRQ